MITTQREKFGASDRPTLLSSPSKNSKRLGALTQSELLISQPFWRGLTP
jgi:hypothetical protein